MFNDLNPMNNTTYGFHWKYNVCSETGPIKHYGKVFYVVDDFGNIIIISATQLNISIRNQ